MSKKKSNYAYNYPKLKQYLKETGFEYEEYNNGRHFKIMGITACIELWPSSMVFHILESEYPSDGKFHRNELDWHLNPEQLDDLLAA